MTVHFGYIQDGDVWYARFPGYRVECCQLDVALLLVRREAQARGLQVRHQIRERTPQEAVCPDTKNS